VSFGDMIKKAVAEHDAALAGRIVDRARAMGCNYADIYGAVRRQTGIEQPDWDALLEEADDADARAQEPQ
jgi:hypothetical protein